MAALGAPVQTAQDSFDRIEALLIDRYRRIESIFPKFTSIKGANDSRNYVDSVLCSVLSKSYRCPLSKCYSGDGRRLNSKERVIDVLRVSSIMTQINERDESQVVGAIQLPRDSNLHRYICSINFI